MCLPEGYLNATGRRRDFAALGATATDHGHASALITISRPESDKLFNKILAVILFR